MQELPYFKYWVKDNLAALDGFTTAQVGAYHLLINRAWLSSDCSLPDDDHFLARCTRMQLSTWQRNKGTILSAWELGEDKKWRLRNLLKQKEEYSAVIAKRSYAGHCSALKRNNSRSTHAYTSSQQEDDICVYNQSHSHSHIKPPPIPPRVNHPYKIENHLSDLGLIKAKAAAPGWDIYFLMRQYDQTLERRDGPPKDADRAFPEWVRRFTKNRPPP